MVGWFEDEGLIADSPPIVGAQENAGNPHYGPTETKHRGRSATSEVLLLDLWGKLPQPGAVYADITWVGFTGETVRTDTSQRVQRRARRPRRRGRSGQERGRRRRASSAASRSIARAAR